MTEPKGSVFFMPFLYKKYRNLHTFCMKNQFDDIVLFKNIDQKEILYKEKGEKNENE